ncbi:MAG: YceI family protein [Candidatus Hydrogenedentes bacterium]|nr:YceI family protein [Candidatus Hydrogenedentota bacterium]
MRTRSAAFLASIFLIGATLLAGCGETTPPPAPAASDASSTEPAKPEPAPTADTTPAGETKPVEPAPSSTEPAAPAAEGKVTYDLTLETAIVWAASVPIGTRKGGWADFTGTIEVENGNFETAKISVEVQMASVFSDAAEITEKMKGDEHFFAPGKYPTSTFKSTSVSKTDTGYDVTGDLTIRDKTKSVVLPVTDLKIDGKSLTCKSTTKLNRHDFGVEYNTTIGDYVIEDLCDLTLDVVAEAK